MGSDFTIIKDGWAEPGQALAFTVPDTLDSSAQGLVQFMLALKHAEGTHVSVKINGTEAWTWEFRQGNRYMSVHEVIRGDLLKVGDNEFVVEIPEGNQEYLQVSDVVVWFKTT